MVRRNAQIPHALTIANDSGRAIEGVPMGCTGIKAPPSDFQIVVSVLLPTGGRSTWTVGAPTAATTAPEALCHRGHTRLQ